MRDLSSLSNQELEDFFNSFDRILSDIDGVLWNALSSIPGTDEAVRSLKKIGKKIAFVTNNTSKSLETHCEQLRKAGFNVEKDDVVTPTPVMISYLKKQNLAGKKIFLLGTPPVKEALIEAGFELAENGPDRINETLKDLAFISVQDDGTVGVVISEVAINSISYVNLQKAATFLERPEVLFLKGATDVTMPAGLNKILIGPGVFHKILEDKAKRIALPMAKPGPYLHEYIVEKFGVKDVSRVLFIGDSIPEDMGFAAASGYRKLLVLSGLSTKNSLDNFQFPDEFKPDFYVDSLKTVNDLIWRVFRKQF